jgi:hypothetical protein
VSSFGIATSIASLALCIPWKKLWNPDVSGHCIDNKAYFIAIAALGMIFDIAVFILPIPVLWALRRKKLILNDKHYNNV